jgi:hypothetical protein
VAAKELYERDFFEWAIQNAELLRAGRLDEADLEHIAEEIEGLGISQKKELYSRLRVLLMHLLKWKFQPEARAGSSWRSTIRTQRAEMDALFDFAPSLRRTVEENMQKAYPKAISDASDETRLPKSAFPPTCPFTPDQVLDEEFFPE